MFFLEQDNWQFCNVWKRDINYTVLVIADIFYELLITY